MLMSLNINLLYWGWDTILDSTNMKTTISKVSFI